MMRPLLLLLSFFATGASLIGCSSLSDFTDSVVNFSGTPPLPGQGTVYPISEERAQDVAYNALAATKPGRKISPVGGTVRGYSTFSHSIDSSYTLAVYTIPAQGVGSSGKPVSGIYFAVEAGGKGKVAEAKANELRAALASELRSLPQGVSATGLRVGKYGQPARQYGRGAAFQRRAPSSAPVTASPAPPPQYREPAVQESVPGALDGRKRDSLEVLERLKELQDKGIITPEDYERKKRQILDRL